MLFVDGNAVVFNNAYQGVTVRSGSVPLTAGSHSIVIAYYQGGGGYGMYADVQVPGGTLQRIPNALLNTYANLQVGSLGGAGNVVLGGSNSLTVGGNNNDSAFSGMLSGSGSLVKNGTGVATLAGSASASSTTVNAGTLNVDGTLSSPASVTGGTLGGVGTVQGAVVTSSGSTLTGGDSLSTAGKLTALPTLNGTLNEYLNGTTAGTGYDQIAATGSTAVTVGANSALHVSVGPAFTASPPAVGTTFDILSNSTGLPISGTFAGLAQGAPLFDSSGVYKFLISYTGSAANHDVVLTYVGPVQAPTLVGSPVINGDNPNGLLTAAGQGSGSQRSMVEDVVYTFTRR